MEPSTSKSKNRPKNLSFEVRATVYSKKGPSETVGSNREWNLVIHNATIKVKNSKLTIYDALFDEPAPGYPYDTASVKNIQFLQVSTTKQAKCILRILSNYPRHYLLYSAIDPD